MRSVLQMSDQERVTCSSQAWLLEKISAGPSSTPASLTSARTASSLGLTSRRLTSCGTISARRPLRPRLSTQMIQASTRTTQRATTSTAFPGRRHHLGHTIRHPTVPRTPRRQRLLLLAKQRGPTSTSLGSPLACPRLIRRHSQFKGLVLALQDQSACRHCHLEVTLDSAPKTEVPPTAFRRLPTAHGCSSNNSRKVITM